GVGWAGITTWRCRCWRCGSWSWRSGGWEKNAGVDRAADARGLCPAAPAGATQPAADCRGSQPGTTAQCGGAELSLEHSYGQVPAETGEARRIKGYSPIRLGNQLM